MASRLPNHRLGWKVHGWSWPIVWWARRKPRSRIRQRLWDVADYIDGRRALRHLRRRF